MNDDITTAYQMYKVKQWATLAEFIKNCYSQFMQDYTTDSVAWWKDIKSEEKK